MGPRKPQHGQSCSGTIKAVNKEYLFFTIPRCCVTHPLTLHGRSKPKAKIVTKPNLKCGYL